MYLQSFNSCHAVDTILLYHKDQPADAV